LLCENSPTEISINVAGLPECARKPTVYKAATPPDCHPFLFSERATTEAEKVKHLKEEKELSRLHGVAISRDPGLSFVPWLNSGRRSPPPLLRVFGGPGYMVRSKPHTGLKGEPSPLSSMHTLHEVSASECALPSHVSSGPDFSSLTTGGEEVAMQWLLTKSRSGAV